MDQTAADALELGTWLGRGQAFGLAANQSLAAQAKCLRTLRETESYKSLGVTWEQFCVEYVGLSRRRVDELVEHLEEFGETYFRLSAIVCISPDSYRQIARKMVDDSLEIAGELVPIVPENANRIRGAVQRMRSELKQAREQTDLHSTPGISRLMARFDSVYEEMIRLAGLPLITNLQKAELRGLANYASERLSRLARLVEER
jgi:hypothetical protein